jgi:hypothetical protein
MAEHQEKTRNGEPQRDLTGKSKLHPNMPPPRRLTGPFSHGQSRKSDAMRTRTHTRSGIGNARHARRGNTTLAAAYRLAQRKVDEAKQ